MMEKTVLIFKMTPMKSQLCHLEQKKNDILLAILCGR